MVLFTNNFFNNINKLPEEIVQEIYEYIPNIIKMFLTKKFYLENHYLIRNYINKNRIETYIRTMVRQDNDFVFRNLLFDNLIKWLTMRNYYYKSCIYANYIYFLYDYSLENESVKCIDLLVDLFKKLGLYKNQHKKNTVKYIRWKT